MSYVPYVLFSEKGGTLDRFLGRTGNRIPEAENLFITGIIRRIKILYRTIQFLRYIKTKKDIYGSAHGTAD
jgi:hypothetical protein